MPATVAACKFVGTISLGLLTVRPSHITNITKPTRP